MGKALRLLISHQDGPRVVKIAGKRLQMDPRRWNDEMTVTVHVGKAGESRDRTLMGLNMLAQKQEAIMMQGGPSNPMVGLPEYRTTLAMMAEAMGHRNPGKFFKEIPEGWQPPPPGPDPKTAEVQQKGELAKAELQAKTQLQAAEFQSRQQLQGAELTNKVELAQMQAQFDAQIASQKANTEREIAALKASNEMEIARVRIEAESQIARERMQAEMQLASWKAAQDVKIKKHAVKVNAKSKAANQRPNGNVSSVDDVQFGGQIG
jgi:Fe-S cluster assembly iron-binding protein IscA